MDERDRELLPSSNDTKGSPPDRRVRDGAAGAGDMLGGLGAGAGDRLGPDDGGAFDPSNQHSFADEEFATDTARHYHGSDSPA